MDKNNRKFRRSTTDVRVLIGMEKRSKKERAYLNGIAKNCLFGGIFITTDHLLRKGHITRLNFQLDDKYSNQQQVYALGIVRWVQRWKKPKGMGIDFVEFEGLGENSYSDWIKQLFSSESE